MSTNTLTDPQWEKIYTFLRAQSKLYISNEQGCRRFIEGLFWIFNTGETWRSLPSQYGKWNSLFKRYTRWRDQGVFSAMLAHFDNDEEMKKLLPAKFAS